MVATRRGVRVVESPTKTTRDESSSASDSGTSSRRRTRKTAAPQEEDHPPTENKGETLEAKIKVTSADAEEEKPAVEEPIAPVENQPDDIHDADVSDSESCCSVVSDSQGPSTRSTRRRGRPAKTPAKTKSGSEAVSEAESCASAVSATPRRSTRTQKKMVGGDGIEISEAESCSSATSLSRRGTRSQRKAAAPQSASHTEDTELSEHESPRDDLRTSTLRKSTRGRRAKPVEPVPIDLEDSGDVSSSSVSRKTPGRRAKAAPAETSEDHKSAASTRRSTRSRAKDPAVRGTSDSESDLTGYSSMGSPRGTPCSSRTGSASSNRAVIVTRVTRSLRSDLTHASSPLRAEAQTPSKGDAPLSDTMETEETMEVDEHEATVVVTGEEGQASLLAEEGEGDKTLIAEEEEEKEKGVIVVDPAVLEDAEENTSTAGPSVVVTETQSPDTEMTEEISPAVEEPAEKVPPKASVIVSGETGEAVQSDLGSVDTQETPCADSASVTVFEVAEADTTEEVDEGNDKPQPATDDQVRSEQTVKVTAELDSNTAEVTGEIAEVETVSELDVPCEQAVKVTICDASESKEETLNDASVHADSSIQDAAEDDKEPTVLHGSSVQSVQVQQDEEDQPMEVDSTDDVLVSRISSSVHVEVSAAQEGDQLPTGSGTSLKRPAVSLLDSSDDEEEDDSDACSLTGEPAKGQEASESEEDDDDDDDEAVTAFAKPKAKAQIVSSDGLFVIDTAPQSSRAFYTKDRPSAGEGQDGDETMKEARGQEEEDEEFVDEEGDEEDEDSQILFTSRDAASKELSCAIDPGLKMKELGGLYISFDGSKSKKISSSQKSLKDHKHLDELMKKSVIVPDLEKKESIPPYKESMNATKLKRRLERQKTTGDGWFNMKAPEMTEELKNDLKALQMRSAMDPKRFYKKNDREGFAKYVQVGTVVDSPLDFYNSRIPKKERKRTMVEELLADAEFRSYNKKKFQEIMTDRAAQLAGKKHRKKKFKSK